MRSSFLAILCLSVAGAMAEDLILGERQEGDYVVTNRTIFKVGDCFSVVTRDS